MNSKENYPPNDRLAVKKEPSASRVVARCTMGGRQKIPLLIVAGILTGLSYLFMQFLLAWICLIPLLLALEKRNMKDSIAFSWFYGIITASVLYYWAIPVAIRYSGVLTIYSILMYAGAALYFSAYSVAFGVGYNFLHRRSRNRVMTGVSVAAFYVLLELTRMKLFPGLPWFHYNLALTQAQHGWIIQWAAIGGLPLIIFAIVFSNYVLAQSILQRQKKLLHIGLGVIVVFFAGGFLLGRVDNGISGEGFRVILLGDNISAETRWDDQIGDSLANVLFRLNEDATQSDPDLIVWSETAVPWRFNPDDRFIPTVLGITRRSKAAHLLGTWSPLDDKSELVYNSAYLINSDGTVTGRHDKTVLLDFLERPFGGGLLSALPFMNMSRYNHVLSGRSPRVITIGKAKLGVLICNESLSEEIYARYGDANANLFVVMSNDAWFENTPLPMHHFYITRLEAVMAGRDVVVNSNRGIVGIIRRNGSVEAVPQSNTARVVSGIAHLSSKSTPHSKLKDFAVPFYGLLVCLSVVARRR